MAQLDILICSLNKGIVRVDEMLNSPDERVRYIVSYQYTDERYLDLIPQELLQRSDVTIYKHKGQGLSANRNLALEKATSELVMFVDDDTHIEKEAFDVIFQLFDVNKDLDIAFFQASTYNGVLLKPYPNEEAVIDGMPENYSISMIEMVCKREKIQGKLRFDERFGLGTKFLTCGEEDIWIEDAKRAGLTMKYYPIKIAATSTLLKKSLVYVDAGVQRSKGALTYYLYGSKAWWMCFKFSLNASINGLCHFWPMMKHQVEGIRYMQRTK